MCSPASSATRRDARRSSTTPRSTGATTTTARRDRRASSGSSSRARSRRARATCGRRTPRRTISSAATCCSSSRDSRHSTRRRSIPRRVAGSTSGKRTRPRGRASTSTRTRKSTRTTGTTCSAGTRTLTGRWKPSRSSTSAPTSTRCSAIKKRFVASKCSSMRGRRPGSSTVAPSSTPVPRGSSIRGRRRFRTGRSMCLRLRRARTRPIPTSGSRCRPGRSGTGSRPIPSIARRASAGPRRRCVTRSRKARRSPSQSGRSCSSPPISCRASLR